MTGSGRARFAMLSTLLAASACSDGAAPADPSFAGASPSGDELLSPCADTIVEDPRPIDEIVAGLDDHDPEVRRDALLTLARRRAPSAARHLSDHALDPSDAVRGAVIAGFWELDGERPGPLRTLFDVYDRSSFAGDVPLSTEVVGALADLGPGAANAIPAALRGATDTLRARVAQGAASMADEGWGAGRGGLCWDDLVPALVEGAADADASVRSSCLYALLRVPSRRRAVADRFLVGVLDGADTANRIEVMERLARGGALALSAVPALVRDLGTNSVAARRAALRALASVGADAPRDVEVLIRWTKPPATEAERVCAVRALGRAAVLSDDARTALESALGDEAAGVCAAAAIALHVQGVAADRLWPALVARLAGRPESYGSHVAIAFDVMGERAADAIAELERLARLEASRDDAVEALGGIGEPAVPALVRLLRTEAPRTRSLGARRLAEIGRRGGSIDAAVPPLADLLDDADDSVVIFACEAIEASRAKSSDIDTRLVAAARARVRIVRDACVSALARGGAASVPRLLALGAERDMTIAVLRVLKWRALADDATVRFALGCLASESAFVREAAVRTLAEIGVRRPDVDKALRKIALDPESPERVVATEGLKRLAVNDRRAAGPVALLRSPLAGDREWAADTIARSVSSSPEVVAALTKAAAVDDGSSLLVALARTGATAPDAIALLRLGLGADDVAVRVACARALLHNPDWSEAAVRSLRSDACDSRGDQAAEAARALRESGRR